MTELIAQQLRQLPNKPGVYLMKNAQGNILYVGKAASLRNRVKSYFGNDAGLTPKTRRLVTHIHELEFFVTVSEQEALILEANLIKKYQPPYNISLRDDKSFPYLKISLNEDWPRVEITRRSHEPSARYFGPFASAKSIRETMKLIKRIFPFRSCKEEITGAEARPCLEYHIGRCLGPCAGQTSKEEYAEVIKEVISFLEGKQEAVARETKARMEQAAKELKFEKAALLRDQLQAIESVIESQRIATTVKSNQDAIAFVQDKDQACVQVFFIREGKLIGRESFALRGTSSEEPVEIMTSFVKQYYNSATLIPPTLLLQYPIEDQKAIEEWLTSRRGGRVNILIPRRGMKKQLVAMVEENARQSLELIKIKQLTAPAAATTALTEIEKALRLPHAPYRMEAYDISNIQGTSAVGSMVVFEEGRPRPSHYRRFGIKTVSGSDDYAMLQEVLRRRFKRGVKNGGDEKSDAWAILPDLILIDGGKGQLNAALDVMRKVDLGSVPLSSLAKENEELYLPQQAKPVILPRSSLGLQLLQRLRDEAHRFALGYHQKVRQKKTFASALDGIPGIGPKRKRALLKQFGSVQAIREASVEELATAPGMSQHLSVKLKELL